MIYTKGDEIRTGTVVSYRPSSGTVLEGLVTAEITLEDHEDDTMVSILLSDVVAISPGERDAIIASWPKLMPDLGAEGFTVTDAAGNLVRTTDAWAPQNIASVSEDEPVEPYRGGAGIPGTERTSSSSSEEDSDKKKVAIIAAVLVLLLFLD